MRISKRTYLDEQEEVGILALGGGPLALLDVVLDDIDTLPIARYVRNSGADADDSELTILSLPKALSCLRLLVPPNGRLMNCTVAYITLSEIEDGASPTQMRPKSSGHARGAFTPFPTAHHGAYAFLCMSSLPVSNVAHPSYSTVTLHQLLPSTPTRTRTISPPRRRRWMQTPRSSESVPVLAVLAATASVVPSPTARDPLHQGGHLMHPL